MTSIDCMLMEAMHVYIPPWEVWRGLNSRSRVDSLPLMITMLAGSSHSTSGWTVRPSTTVTLQVSVSISPAVGVPTVSIVTTGAFRAVLRIKKSQV